MLPCATSYGGIVLVHGGKNRPTEFHSKQWEFTPKNYFVTVKLAKHPVLYTHINESLNATKNFGYGIANFSNTVYYVLTGRLHNKKQHSTLKVEINDNPTETPLEYTMKLRFLM